VLAPLEAELAALGQLHEVLATARGGRRTGVLRRRDA